MFLYCYNMLICYYTFNKVYMIIIKSQYLDTKTKVYSSKRVT